MLHIIKEIFTFDKFTLNVSEYLKRIIFTISALESDDVLPTNMYNIQ